jgi:hypothetical protein
MSFFQVRVKGFLPVKIQTIYIKFQVLLFYYVETLLYTKSPICNLERKPYYKH